MININNKIFNKKLEDYYYEIMNPIDECRSLNHYVQDNEIKKEKIIFYASNFVNSNEIVNINGKKILPITRETRTHAYYRMIGLPISDGNFYFNPGVDPDVTPEREKIKIEISNRFFKTFSYKRLQERDEYQELIYTILKKNNIGSSAFILSTLIKRKFSDIIKDPYIEPLSIEKEDNESYFSVGDFKDVRDNYLFLYSEKIGTEYEKKALDIIKQINRATYFLGKDLGTRPRYVLPLSVDPRIVYAAPSEKSFASPFRIDYEAVDKPTDSQFKFKQPLIEKICRERFASKKPKSELSESEAQALERSEKLKESSPSLSTTSGYDLFYTNEKDIFYYKNFINLAKEMMKALKNTIEAAQKAQLVYNILPLAPLGTLESSLTNVFDIINPYNTTQDINIASLILKVSEDTAAASFNELTKYLSSEKSSSSDSGSASVDQKSQSNSIDSLSSSKRDRSFAEEVFLKCLTEVDYLTGEISGFGLLDHLVMEYALRLVDESALISLLDEPSYERAKNKIFDLSLPSNRIPINDALQKLSQTIRDLYFVLDLFYEDSILLS